ncbi:MAG: LysR family transcriptional regulator [Rhodovibrionaceae bacterium]
MAIGLPQLRVFVAVAEFGNIKDAAARLGRTASAVSMSLSQLEQELGGRLFSADRKSVLTALGDYVYATAKPELQRFDNSIAAMQAYARNEIGRLDIACVPSVASRLLPDILGAFLAERPRLECDVRDSDSADVLRAVEQGEVELGIAGLPQRSTSVVFTPLFRDAFVLVCPAGSPLAQREAPLAWQDLTGARFIANGAMAALDNAVCRELTARSPLMVRNVLSLLAMVRAGLGFTLLPELSVSQQDAGLAYARIADDSLYRVVGLLTRSNGSLSPAAAAFRDLLLEQVYDVAGALKS